MNRKIKIYESKEIGKVIDFMKSEKNILAISSQSGITTITSNTLVLLAINDPIKLKVGQIITIGTINYPVLTVDYKLNKYTIQATGLTATKWNLAISYKFGSRTEINELLSIEARDENLKLKRFPLIWLFLNDGRDHENTNFDFEVNLKIAFVHLSGVNMKAQDRLTNVFEPVLDPLKELFLETIKSPYFYSVFNWEYMEFRYKDFFWYFYGSTDKNQQVLDSVTDAIEVDIPLLFNNQY